MGGIMTRINLVPPQELHRKHLIAEIRELPRIMTLARKPTEHLGSVDNWIKAKKPPTAYVLGGRSHEFLCA
jgi:deoxyribonuclease (pyrimidine dimer)